MIDFPIVDTHVHLWDPAHIDYAWHKDVPVLDRPFVLKDYDEACGAVSVEKMVFLECDCGQAQREADWVSSLAKQDPRLAGIVAWAPIEKGEGAREALELLTRDPLVKGARRIIQFEDDLEFCLQPDFVKGVQLLSEFGLSFDLCIAHVHLPNAIKLVEQCPDVSFVLDHIGKPDIKSGLLDPWQANLKTLASFDNVHCKLSGLVTEADHTAWTPADLQPYIDPVVSCFGFERLMFGGDWPVATLATTYPRWVETLCDALAGSSDDELRKLFVSNAYSFYRL